MVRVGCLLFSAFVVLHTAYTAGVPLLFSVFGLFSVVGMVLLWGCKVEVKKLRVVLLLLLIHLNVTRMNSKSLSREMTSRPLHVAR